ncbi:MAG: PAC2 family protein [Anaerolineales bacterium]|nr:MAG: PAC2 family protein [Anaerolineales bacterium]
MDNLIQLWEKPVAEEIYMIAGWRQWADAGAVSSGLPKYLIERTGAKKIGEIRPDGFYLFQIPGTHHLLRPNIELSEGYRQQLSSRENEFFYAGDEKKGMLIFLGDEPHLNVERYAEAFLDAVENLGVRRVAAVGGVHGAMPFDKDREISCVYSLPGMKAELTEYAVKFSNYEGGSTIGTYLVDRAERRRIGFLDFYAFVPAYDFSKLTVGLQGMRVETDYKAWYDLMRRFNHMFDLGIDLSDLERQSSDLMDSMVSKIDELEKKMPQLKVREYMQTLASDFTELPFMPLDDVWERELGDLFGDVEE